MAHNPPSSDRYPKALDLAVNFLQEHEQFIDQFIASLSTYTEQMSQMNLLKGKIESIDEKMSALERDIMKLKQLCLKQPH
jgi:hypothetical protein